MKPVTGPGPATRPAPAARLGRGGRRLLVSATVSRLADSAATVAMVLVIITRSHDPRLAGLVVAAFALPTLVTGPVLGAYLDGLRARRALFAANQVLLAGALTAVLVCAGHVPGAVLIGIGLCAGLTAPVLTGGFSSLVPLVVPPAGLLRANAVDAASYNIAGLGGPGLVAVLAAALGAGVALGAVAAIAGAGVVLVLAVPMPAAGPPGATDPLVTALRDGLGLLWRDRLLRATTATTTITELWQGLLPVTLPLLAVQLGDRAAIGAWFLTAISAGGLAGALASERLLARRPAQVVIIGSIAGFGLSLLALAFSTHLGLALVLSALAGVADGPLLAATLKVRQHAVPARRYAQISATAASVKTGSYALGAALSGLLATALTARQLLLTVAGGQLLALAPMARVRSRPAGRLRPSRDGT